MLYFHTCVIQIELPNTAAVSAIKNKILIFLLDVAKTKKTIFVYFANKKEAMSSLYNFKKKIYQSNF